MKRSIAVILLFAFVAQIYASHELDAYLTEDMEDDSDRHPYVQCKIDLYDCMRKGAQSKSECLKAYYNCMKQLVPTVPPFVVQCKDELKNCVATATGFVNKGKCFVEFAKCLKNGGPSSPSTFLMDDVVPDRHPYVQCKIDLYDCIRLKKKSKMECLKDYKSCMLVLIPTVPPFVIACKDELKSCVSGASGILDKAVCFRDFGKCLINKGPSPTAFDAGEFVLNAMEDGPAPTRHPYFQCKIDLYKCMKEGQKGKLQCLKDYKSCMAQLIPTVPPFLVKCRDDLKTCLSSSDGWKAKAQCFVDFGKCIKNKGSA